MNTDNSDSKELTLDQAIQLACTDAQPAPRHGLWKLPIVKRHRRLLPSVERRLDMIDPELLAKLRRLAVGELPWPLFIWGGVGSGKTCACLALADVVATAMYITPDELADAIMEGRAAEIWEKVREKDLAICDELGTRLNVGDLAYTALLRFADLREQHARPTIFISNLNSGAIGKLYDQRIISRISRGTEYKLKSPDRRKSK